MAEREPLSIVRRLLRLPPPPEPPAGVPDSVRVFRAARGFLRYSLLGWAAKQVSALVGIVFGFGLIDRVPEHVSSLSWLGLLWPFEVIGLALFVLQIPFTCGMVILDYRYRWYMVTDRSLRIREGVLRIREQTMGFANIQNLAIEQGPVQRLFGIYNLRVRTAGGGEESKQGGSEGHSDDNLHVGYFRGIEQAEEIRDSILRRLRGFRDSGLGDPDEPSPAAIATTPGESPQARLRAAIDRLVRVVG